MSPRRGSADESSGGRTRKDCGTVSSTTTAPSTRFSIVFNSNDAQYSPRIHRAAGSRPAIYAGRQVSERSARKCIRTVRNETRSSPETGQFPAPATHLHRRSGIGSIRFLPVSGRQRNRASGYVRRSRPQSGAGSRVITIRPFRTMQPAFRARHTEEFFPEGKSKKPTDVLDQAQAHAAGRDDDYQRRTARPPAHRDRAREYRGRA